MAVWNGGEVPGTTWRDEMAFIDKYSRRLLINHRSKHFAYLTDELMEACPDLKKLVTTLRVNGHPFQARDILGRLRGMMLIRYVECSVNPQQFAYMCEKLFMANWIIMVIFLQRKTKKLYHTGKFPKPYLAFHIKHSVLKRISIRWADEMLPIVQSKMLPHYHDLMSGRKRKNQYRYEDGGKVPSTQKLG